MTRCRWRSSVLPDIFRILLLRTASTTSTAGVVQPPQQPLMNICVPATAYVPAAVCGVHGGAAVHLLHDIPGLCRRCLGPKVEVSSRQ